MKKAHLVVLAIIVIPIIGFTFIGFAMTSIGDGCMNIVIDERTNEENRMKAIVFDRNCGATTSLSRQVSLLKEGKELPNETGNVFTSSHYEDVQVKWIDLNHLEITRSGKGKDFLMKESIDSIKITYKLTNSEQGSGGNG